MASVEVTSFIFVQNTAYKTNNPQGKFNSFKEDIDFFLLNKKVLYVSFVFSMATSDFVEPFI